MKIELSERIFLKMSNGGKAKVCRWIARGELMIKRIGGTYEDNTEGKKN